jgi:hypothetical protein
MYRMTCELAASAARGVLGIALLLTATVESSVPQTAPSDSSLIANPVYTKNCAKYHGKTLLGSSPHGHADCGADTIVR